jgi:hypothetical protein
MQLKHRPVVFHVHGNLLIRLTMQHSKRCPDFDLVLCSSAQKRTNHTILLVSASEVVVQYREERDRMNSHILGYTSGVNMKL